MMKTAKMTVVVLIVAAMTGAALAAIPALAESEKSILISDLNFPLIQLPAAFDSHRSTERLDLSEGQEYKLIDAKGPGCVRHFWITTTAPNGLNIEITCDGAEEPRSRCRCCSSLEFYLAKILTA